MPSITDRSVFWFLSDGTACESVYRDALDAARFYDEVVEAAELTEMGDTHIVAVFWCQTVSGHTFGEWVR
jgi:hypothetical protein